MASDILNSLLPALKSYRNTSYYFIKNVNFQSPKQNQRKSFPGFPDHYNLLPNNSLHFQLCTAAAVTQQVTELARVKNMPPG